MYEYELIRSERKTLALEITRDGKVLVRAPMRTSKKDIAAFAARHESWVAEKLQKQAERRERFPEPDDDERAGLIAAAKEQLPALISRYAAEMGVVPAGMSITSARTRFGSCSAKNRLCFSYRLMQYPPRAIEYVVVHELAHIRHKNHGKDFYAFIASVMPDYREREKLLR